MLLLGCIADDLTGATDLALILSREGMRVVQVIGVPGAGWAPGEADAVVVALKSRNLPAPEAVALSLRGAEALLAAGARQLFFKYCSTFDSTDEGNIGPVAAALMALLDAPFTIVTPAFPANGRRVFQGHLFVGDRLLSESPMRDHPLTPMRDADLVRVLGRQTPLRVGLVAHDTVEAGEAEIGAAFRRAAAEGVRIAVVDALSEAHLRAIGAAARGLRLVTGASGLALGLPRNFRRAGLLREAPAPTRMQAPPGRAAILAGSCSAATRGQIACARAAGLPSLRLCPDALAEGRQDAGGMLAWAAAQAPDRPVLIHSAAEPGELLAVQARLGRGRAAALIEEAFAALARGLVEHGVTRLIVAGGETAGAVVEGLGIGALAIGPEIDPGVPWTRTSGPPDLCLALKSGNFGAEDFFTRAWGLLA